LLRRRQVADEPHLSQSNARSVPKRSVTQTGRPFALASPRRSHASADACRPLTMMKYKLRT
jgi:hypothetical protein